MVDKSSKIEEYEEDIWINHEENLPNKNQEPNLKLEDALQDPEKIVHFKQFLEKEHNNENLLFWMEVESFKNTTDKEQLRKRAQTIYQKFIHSDGPLVLNLPFKFMQKIEDIMKNKNEISSNLFDEAQAEIFKLMQMDPFPRYFNIFFLLKKKRFLKSAFYSAIYASANKKKINIPLRVFDEVLLDGDEEEGFIILKIISNKSVDNNWGPPVAIKKDIKIFKKMYKDSKTYCFKSHTTIHVPANEVFLYYKKKIINNERYLI